MSQQHCWFFQCKCREKGQLPRPSALLLAETRYLTQHFKGIILRGGRVDLWHSCCNSQICSFQLINAYEREVIRLVLTPGKFSHIGSNTRRKKKMHLYLTSVSKPHLNGESVEVVEHDMVRFWEQCRVTLERAKKV